MLPNATGVQPQGQGTAVALSDEQIQPLYKKYPVNTQIALLSAFGGIPTNKYKS